MDLVTPESEIKAPAPATKRRLNFDQCDDTPTPKRAQRAKELHDLLKMDMRSPVPSRTGTLRTPSPSPPLTTPGPKLAPTTARPKLAPAAKTKPTAAKSKTTKGPGAKRGPGRPRKSLSMASPTLKIATKPSPKKSVIKPSPKADSGSKPSPKKSAIKPSPKASASKQSPKASASKQSPKASASKQSPMKSVTKRSPMKSVTKRSPKHQPKRVVGDAPMGRRGPLKMTRACVYSRGYHDKKNMGGSKKQAWQGQPAVEHARRFSAIDAAVHFAKQQD
ncbi:unnamed protein product [Symbiodinium sp. CCMP2592]|nr:unnamed protein product [Symbiodinium sp. CCMP2592]